MEYLFSYPRRPWTCDMERPRECATLVATNVIRLVNEALSPYSPVQLLSGMLVLLVVSKWLVGLVTSLRSLVARQSSGYGPAATAVRVVATIVADLPVVRGIVARERTKVIAKLREDMRASRAETGVTPIRSLPVCSTKRQRELLRMIDDKRKALGETTAGADRMSKASGAVYVGDAELLKVLDRVYSAFSLANPMHAGIFPTTRAMEAEVVQMTASLVGGGSTKSATAGGINGGTCGTICGSMTSGGTESILTAVKASRDYMRHHRRITKPEMVIAPSAHAAFIKAAEYFNIAIVKAPLDRGHRLTSSAVLRCLSRNTVLVVASAVGYPHGVLDDVEGIAALCNRRGILMHVDCCLGGFVLPFLKHVSPSMGGTEGEQVEDYRFDFNLKGVTSMSLDVHKFGCSHKGTSVVLYRSPEIRRHQYTSITDWSGGLYISPGFAGSRNGALIATAWAAMVYHGLEGYVENTKHMMRCATRFKQAIASPDELARHVEMVGIPAMSVVAFTSRPGRRNIYVVNDLLGKKGWRMSALQNPPALHMCFTPAHSMEICEALIRDLREAYADNDGDHDDDEGMAPLYGMAAKVPDKRIIGEFLTAYQDLLLEA